MMKAITLYHPFPELIAFGEKTNETRSWATPHRGPLAIHVATSRRPWHMNLGFQEPFSTALKPLLTNVNGHKAMRLHLGTIIAVCNLVDCVPITPEVVATLSDKERAFGDYSEGRFAWVLKDVHQLAEPIPAKGMQRLWNWDETPHLITIDPYKVGPTQIWTPKGIMSGRLVVDQTVADGDYIRGLEVI